MGYKGSEHGVDGHLDSNKYAHVYSQSCKLVEQYDHLTSENVKRVSVYVRITVVSGH